MKAVLALPMALLLALSVPALAQKGTIGDKPPSTGVKGAPGPLAGAGLPVLLIGGGIYWIVRRRKKTKLGS
jgi:LPXTG-motif cell wall-anchored protein